MTLNNNTDVVFENDRFSITAGEGDGESLATAYDIDAAKAYQGEENKWVKGYIVGYMANGEFVPGAEGAPFSNMVISSEEDAQNADNILTVQLVGGSLPRAQLNLGDNPDNLGKEVWLLGNLEAYFSVAGIKAVSKFSWDGENVVEEETPDLEANTTIQELIDLYDGSEYHYYG